MLTAGSVTGPGNRRIPIARDLPALHPHSRPQSGALQGWPSTSGMRGDGPHGDLHRPASTVGYGTNDQARRGTMESSRRAPVRSHKFSRSQIGLTMLAGFITLSALGTVTAQAQYGYEPDLILPPRAVVWRLNDQRLHRGDAAAIRRPCLYRRSDGPVWRQGAALRGCTGRRGP